jgi:hypothetical protein
LIQKSWNSIRSLIVFTCEHVHNLFLVVISIGGDMLNRKFGVLLAFATSALLLAACAPAAGVQEEEPTEVPTSEVIQEPTQAPTEEMTDVPPSGGSEGALDVIASSAAIAALAEKLNVTPEEITMVFAEHVEWSDSCLGLGGADEMCAQVITPGFRVTLEVNGQQYEVHTDETGTNIRFANEVQ